MPAAPFTLSLFVKISKCIWFGCKQSGKDDMLRRARVRLCVCDRSYVLGKCNSLIAISLELAGKATVEIISFAELNNEKEEIELDKPNSISSSID